MLHRRLAVLPLLVAASPARADSSLAPHHGPMYREYEFSDDSGATLVVPQAPMQPAIPTQAPPEIPVQASAEIPVQAALVVPMKPLGCGGVGLDYYAVHDASTAACLRGELPEDYDHAFAGEGLYRPPIEWSTWFRFAYGVATQPALTRARSIEPVPVESDRRGTWDLGLGIEASLSASKHGDVRLGGWAEQRGLSTRDTFGGGEIVVTRVPKRFDLFLYEGHGIAALRVGRSKDAATTSLAWGYVAPYWLEGACRKRFFDIYTGICHARPQRLARYMAGVRVVGTVTHVIDAPREWSATLGLEFEPVGAVRANLGIRSWYRN